MSRTYRRTAGLVVVGALASSALVMPALGQAKSKSHKVNMLSSQSSQVGIKLKAVYTGTPFGKCKMTGTLVLPVSKQLWKCKGGSFKVNATGTLKGDAASGTYKMFAGKGKFKGISGKGKFAGSLSKGVFRYKGTAKY